MNLGQQAQKIRKSHKCMWVQVVHTAPAELGMYKGYSNAITQSGVKNKREVRYCKIADLVMAVGPKLKGFYSNQLRAGCCGIYTGNYERVKWCGAVARREPQVSGPNVWAW